MNNKIKELKQKVLARFGSDILFNEDYKLMQDLQNAIRQDQRQIQTQRHESQQRWKDFKQGMGG